MRSEHFQRASMPASTAVAILAAGAIGLATLLWPDSGAVREAHAGPPSPSALTIQQKAGAEEASQLLDSGRQREELVRELRALRQDVQELKALMTGGRMRATIGNFDEMPLDRIRLEIDYDRLRDAMRDP